MKHLFLINPAAGACDRSVQLSTAIRKSFDGADFEIHISKGPGDCTRITKQAAQAGSPLRVYACGGDGTLNEVINGAAGFEHVFVTHVPYGSGNDFIKIFSDTSAFRDLNG